MANQSAQKTFENVTLGHALEQELKAFDDAKAGVRGLVEAGMTKIPRIFINPPDDAIPVIDLEGINIDNNDARKEIIDQVQNAAERWGFFEVVNHGIPTEMIEGMHERVRAFHEQPNQAKSKFYTRDGMKRVVYNSFFDIQRKAVYWRDTISFMTAPSFPHPSETPEQFRDILMDYSESVTDLGRKLLELLSEALGFEKEHLIDKGCMEVLYISCHYYPPCPTPELTIGTPRHADMGFLTILQQDRIGGLQVLHEDKWIDIPPIDGALIINIGDCIQLLSNNKFRSAEHRVLAGRKGPRISVGSFFKVASDIYYQI